MQKEQTYKVVFKGEILPGFEIVAVKQSLAALFNLNSAEVLPLFEGRSIFNRSGLNKFTADQYTASFKKIGAVCHVENELDKPSEKPFIQSVPNQAIHQVSTSSTASDDVATRNPNICPKCQSSNINAEQCLDCGIYIEKFLNNAARHSNEVVNEVSDEEADEQNLSYMKKAINVIKYVTIYMLVVFTFDSFIEDNSESLRYVLDSNFFVGMLPYILGHIGLAVGCYYLALAKGLSGVWGVLGLASLPGLGVLLLLPNKYKSESEGKTKAFAITLIVLSIYWGTDYINKNTAKTEFLEESIALRKERNEYPSKTLDTDGALFESEIKELNQFLDKGFEMLSNYNFRTHEEITIANMMFSETMRLYIWINYQQYLQYRNGKRGSDYLKYKNVSKIKIEQFIRVKNNVKSVGSSTLYKVFQDWFVGYNYMGHGYDFLTPFYVKFSKIKEKIFELPIIGKEKYNPPYFSFNDIEIPKFSTVKVTIEDDIILLDFSDTQLPIRNQKVAIASYYKTYKSYSVTERKEVDSYIIKQVQISPEFPNIYLGGDLSVFLGADISP